MANLIRVAALTGGLLLSGCMAAGNHQPGSDVGFVGQEWIVEDIAGRGVIDYARTTVLFGQDGRVSGDTSCNRYFADFRAEGAKLRIGNAGVTRKTCVPAVMDQERRFLDVFGAVDRYRIDSTGALMLSTPGGATITARRVFGVTQKTTYRCADSSIVEASYPTTDTATIRYEGRSVDMTTAVSASGARYVGDGWEWWTKGMTEGTLSRLASGKDTASAPGVICKAH